ncbi:MAG: stage II sporulation protein D [Oscillibacter sp.]|nr:stage II sporulation protein D [Oscillibacter sp.]
MREYPSQIPSQRRRTNTAIPRPQAVTRTESAIPRQDAAPRQGSVTQWESVTRPNAAAPSAQTIAPRPNVAGTQTAASAQVITRTDAAATRPNVAPTDAATRQESATRTESAPRTSSTRRADSGRRRRARTRKVKKHPLHAVLTASAAMYLLLFLVPFLFTSDAGRESASVSAALKRSPEAAVKAETDSLPADSVAQAESVDRTAGADTFAQGAGADTLAQIAQADALAESVAEAEAAAPEVEPFRGQLDEDCYLRVLNRTNDEVSVMSMQEYLVCVLRGEMPGYFELEALKAQAVAARTYTRYMLHSGSKHGDRADICTSPACCQAYLSAASARQKWGYLPEDEEQKLRAAVIDTDGETMLYDGEPILAVFHASSSGLTRTSGDVWSGDKPYLQPVTSPENADNTPNYYSHVEFTLSRLQDKLRDAFPKANLSGDVSEWLTDAERDAAGNIITMYVGGIKTQGSRVRSALGLRSACFTWEYGDGKVEFYVTGYGHGVGLSQYGANQMARDGADYRAILTHYYTGVRIGGYTPETIAE